MVTGQPVRKARVHAGVSVGPTGVLVRDAEKALLGVVRDSNVVDLDLLLAVCVFQGTGYEPDVSDCTARAAARRGAERSYRDVAVLGFDAARRRAAPGSQPALDAAAKWLSATKPFVDGAPTGIAVDAVALLGVSLA